MKNPRTKWLLFLCCLFTFFSPRVFSQTAKTEADGFQSFFREFQSAVAQNDPEKIATMATFPKFRWEPLTDQDLKTKEEFLKRFPKMFTPEVKKQIAAGRFYKTPDGDYLIDWTARHLQYTLAFDRQAGGDYKFSGLLVGPE